MSDALELKELELKERYLVPEYSDLLGRQSIYNPSGTRCIYVRLTPVEADLYKAEGITAVYPDRLMMKIRLPRNANETRFYPLYRSDGPFDITVTCVPWEFESRKGTTLYLKEIDEHKSEVGRVL